ncbi:hypothetical protein [Parvularcula oceani]|uniref:hypothetical protein n=1 Tax=Parvularcula oceani TaxID=1247963 RepID=UPI0012DEC6BC|nr:hypothetical protein [Parvularcula oceani]
MSDRIFEGESSLQKFIDRRTGGENLPEETFDAMSEDLRIGVEEGDRLSIVSAVHFFRAASVPFPTWLTDALVYLFWDLEDVSVGEEFSRLLSRRQRSDALASKQWNHWRLLTACRVAQGKGGAGKQFVYKMSRQEAARYLGLTSTENLGRSWEHAYSIVADITGASTETVRKDYALIQRGREREGSEGRYYFFMPRPCEEEE